MGTVYLMWKVIRTLLLLFLKGMATLLEQKMFTVECILLLLWYYRQYITIQIFGPNYQNLESKNPFLVDSKAGCCRNWSKKKKNKAGNHMHYINNNNTKTTTFKIFSKSKNPLLLYEHIWSKKWPFCKRSKKYKIYIIPTKKCQILLHIRHF